MLMSAVKIYVSSLPFMVFGSVVLAEEDTRDLLWTKTFPSKYMLIDGVSTHPHE